MEKHHSPQVEDENYQNFLSSLRNSDFPFNKGSLQKNREKIVRILLL